MPAVGIGLINNGQLQECNVFGELRKGFSANDSTIFTIASLTKPVVAMLTLKLVESGSWDLDEPLNKYWIDPDVANDPRIEKLSTRHVLSHQSGFPNWRSDVQSKKLVFNFEPGSRYQYSGEGFEYLQKALEHKFNRSLEELTDSILFAPLGMSNSHYHWGTTLDESRFAYRYNNKGIEYPENRRTNASAAYGLLTTVEDYSNFGIDVINHGELSTKLFDEMVSTQTIIKENIDQGLGWGIFRNLSNNEYALVHEGGSNGVSTLIVLLPVSKRGIVVFTNGDDGDIVYSKVLEKFLDVGKEIISTLNQLSYDPEQLLTIEVSHEILSTYAGSYLIQSFEMSVQVIFEEGLLRLKSPYSTMTLYPESATNFFLKDDDMLVEFVNDANGETTGMIVTIRGAEPEFAKKIE